MLAYQRTYEKILEDLRNDVYPVNSLLPPEPKLEEIYHVSRTTVRRAIAQLADEGYVKVKQGFKEYLSRRLLCIFQAAPL